MAVHDNSGANEVCGLYFLKAGLETLFGQPHVRQYLPLVSLSANATVFSCVSRTKLSQTFMNPSTQPVSVRYTFPLYDGVSVVGFTCTINNDRVIRGLVQERQAARKTFNEAVSRGETAGLLEQFPHASDVFTTVVDNVPAGAEIQVDIVVLGELKHDAEVDGVRYTLPTRVAPRYGGYGESTHGAFLSVPPQPSRCGGMSITVDVEMQAGSVVTSLISPSHPVGVSIGSIPSPQATSEADPQETVTQSLSREKSSADRQPQLASATVSLGTTFLDKDFVLQILATNLSNPAAILETHSSIPGQRALMTTLVPKFNLPSERPEIVFVCDQSGSMAGQKIINLKSALQLFLKSLPVGVKFNICSFGNYHRFLFPEGSRTYDADSLDMAMQAVGRLQADYGGTELCAPIQRAFDKRDARLDLEVFVLTDGQIWDQDRLFDMVNSRQEESMGSIRIFTLGIGDEASSALIEGLARAGNGFAQTVSDHEKLDKKVVRMLKAALTPHISNYTLEIKYSKPESSGPEGNQGEDFELVDMVSDLTVAVGDGDVQVSRDDENISVSNPDEKKPVSLFDPSVNLDDDTKPSLDVPFVSVPRILQTPFRIPSLFAFHRTNVYLLLSPETANNQPQTVTLRATSKHGRLLLDIPITTLTAPGQTIHQLAARKAALELEEGRGWIFHAKHQSVSLKDAYPRELHQMVQREAVRLGVQFQVGGKWCSFVAVEEGNEVSDASSGIEFQKKAAQSKGRANIGGMRYPARKRMSNAMTSQLPGGLFGSRSSQSAQHCPPTGVLFGGLSGGHSTTTTTNANKNRPSFGGQPTASNSLFGGSVTGDQASGRPSQGAGGMGGGHFVPSTEQRPNGGFLDTSFNLSSRRGIGQGYGFGLFNSATHGDDDAVSAYGSRSLFKVTGGFTVPSSGLFGASQAAPSQPQYGYGAGPQIAAQETPLETIVCLQTFDGFWIWNDALVRAIGVKREDVVADQTDVSADVWATITVLVFIRKMLAAEKDSWELMAEKASAWLKSQVAPDARYMIEEKVETMWP